MKIKKLFVNHFGKLDSFSVDFPDGITVISGENESGKSTLHTFIGAMILGLGRDRGRAARTDTHTLYTPWNGGVYGGTIDIEQDGETFSVTRNFSKDSQSCVITNETKSREVSANARNLSHIFAGLNSTSYQNTISVKQLSAGTGGELADELKNHIVNLRSAGSFNLDVTGAINRLKSQKKKIEAGFSKPVQREAEELKTRIFAMEEDLAASDGLPTADELEKQKYEVEREIIKLEKSSNDLNEALARNDETLRRFRVYSPDDIKEVSSVIEKTTGPLDNYFSKHSFNVRPFAKVFFLIGLFFCILIAAAGFGYAAYNYLHKAALPTVLIFAGVGLVFFVLFIICLCNLISVGRFRKKCRDFGALYESFFGEMPETVDSTTISALMSQPDRLNGLIEWIAEGKEGLVRASKDSDDLRERIRGLDAEIEQAHRRAWQREQKEEALSSLRLSLDMLKDPLKKNDEIISDVAAVNLAIETIENISNDIFESFGHFLEETTSQLFCSMTDGAYQGVSINDSFDIFLLQNGRRVPLRSVSSGTLDQIYLALRLACIEFLWTDQTMPLLLDDTFAMYDKDRLACTLLWLSENYSGQVLIFTCHQREEQILRNMNIPFNLVEL